MKFTQRVLPAKQLEDAALAELGDSYKVLCTFATLYEARAAFEKAKETCSTHWVDKQLLLFAQNEKSFRIK